MEVRNELIIEVKTERNFVKMDSKLELYGVELSTKGCGSIGWN